MARYLDPKNDLVFKRIFGEHPHLLKSFLNALMPLEEGQNIEDLEYLSPENVPENPLKKFSIVDVRCRDNYGLMFIVEMQMEWSTVFPDRMLLNVARTYSRQLERGGEYEDLQPVYGLGILNETFDHKTPEYYHHYQLANLKNLDEKIGGIEVIMVELPKFKPGTATEKKMAALWLRFLKETKDRTTTTGVADELLANKEIHEALDVCEEAAFSDAELEAYEHYWMNISTEKTLLKVSFNEGKAEGKVEGKAEGLAEGLAKGEEERRRLLQENEELKRMLGK